MLRRPAGPRRVVTVAVTAALALAVALPAWAHRPVILTKDDTPGNGPRVTAGEVSFAFYGWLNRPSDTRSFTLTLAAGRRFHLEAFVPDLVPERAIPRQELPRITVLSPDGRETRVPADLYERFHEEHAGTRLIRYARLDRTAEAGTYRVVVTGTRAQRFVVATGQSEREGGLENGAVATVRDVVHWYRTPAPYDPAGL
ncbi:hypothetical protein ACFOWE_12305 [Planomonospora corallina]|uniref:Uncharacterized protein n=1 Tax=Planomonospora corallina TaxID=1806052 RepID=A0ABV8I4F7_9ACTN